VNEWVKRKRALIQDSIRGLTNPEVAEREAERDILNSGGRDANKY